MNTGEAAAHCGMTTGVFRAHMARERAKGNDMRLLKDEWPDQRSPQYDDEKVQEWAANRP